MVLIPALCLGMHHSIVMKRSDVCQSSATRCVNFSDYLPHATIGSELFAAEVSHCASTPYKEEWTLLWTASWRMVWVKFYKKQSPDLNICISRLVDHVGASERSEARCHSLYSRGCWGHLRRTGGEWGKDTGIRWSPHLERQIHTRQALLETKCAFYSHAVACKTPAWAHRDSKCRSLLGLFFVCGRTSQQ